MKKFFLFISFIFISLQIQSARVLIDTIDAVVYTLEGTQIITHSDVLRPSLQGQPRPLEAIVFESLVYLDAEKHKVVPDDDAVDRYLASIMQENDMNQQQLEAVFMEGGRTLQEGREELKRMQTFNTMMDFKIRGNLIVPRKEVEAYYNENPEIEPAQYTLQRAVIPFDAMLALSDQKDQILSDMKQGNTPMFGPSFTIAAPDIAQDRQFILKLKVGQISLPREGEDGFELFRLVSKQEEHERSLEERYREISSILMQPKYMEMMNEYRRQLFDNASMVYFN
jgi:parvulin-like peptidyl-prolyl isomerase